MTKRRNLLVAAMFTLGVGLGAQTVLSRFGVAETHARELSMSAVLGSYGVGNIAKPFLAVPAAARASAVTEVVAWAKLYFNSPTFLKSWADQRDQAKPSAPEVKGTADDETKAKTAEAQKQIDAIKKQIASMPADQRAAMEEMIKQMEASMKSPAMVSMQQEAITSQRAADQKHYQEDLQKWQEEYPADPKVVIAKRLHEFLAMSADVNFDAKLKTVSAQQVFVDPQYEQKPSEWKMCFRAGREATGAARAAATAWLKELGK